jgi:hypothetical protein
VARAAVYRAPAAGPGGMLLSAVGAVATAIVILGVAALPFANPAWIHFEQDRAGAAALTGYSAPDVVAATDGILHDLVFGGDFAVAVGGSVVLDASERGHMRDVRGVFGGFAVAILAAAALLAILALQARGAGAWAVAARARLWAAIRRGAAWLAVVLAVVGAVALVAFDAVFELVHEILFPGGNYTFDPRTEKLVQLFPIQFWSETGLAYGAVALAIAVAVAWYAGTRAVA